MTFDQWMADLTEVLTRPPHEMTADGAKRFVESLGEPHWREAFENGFSPADAAEADGEYI